MKDNNDNNVFNVNDSLDINELASLNDDITPEFIEQLQNKISLSVETDKPDNVLFEEIPRIKKEEETGTKPQANLTINENIDDNFMLKYKAKMNKQKMGLIEAQKEQTNQEISQQEKEQENITQEQALTNTPQKIENTPSQTNVNSEKIESLSGGNIVEKPVINEQIAYNESLDYLDNNTKYSKYVIYIDPENKDFIESLTVKERKNLINRILKEQDDIAITKKRLNLLHTLIKHSIVAIITVAIAIPVIYTTINASLEASINNYRRSQGLFQTLYRQKGKIKNIDTSLLFLLLLLVFLKSSLPKLNLLYNQRLML